MTSLPILYCGAFFVAAIMTTLGTPFWRSHGVKLGLVDNPGERKIHAAPMPLAGGLAVFTGIIAPLALALIAVQWFPSSFSEQMRYGFSRRAEQLTIVIVGATGMLLLGIVDDRWELSSGRKFLGQLVIALLVALSGIRITLFVPSLTFSYVITILWILTVVNAFNFMDNMNGLCAGLAAIASFLFGLAAGLRGEYLTAGLAFLCCGAFCGFLPYNFPRATAFLGDSGSHLAGFIVAVLAILPHYYSRKFAHPFSVLTPLLVLAAPLLDLAAVVIIRWRSGKPFYVGDTNHLSHRLVRRGLTPVQAVLWIWSASLAVGALALLL